MRLTIWHAGRLWKSPRIPTAFALWKHSGQWPWKTWWSWLWPNFSSPDLCAGIKTQWLLTFPTIMIWCLEFSPRLFWSPRFSCKPHLSIYHGICCTTRKWNTIGKVKIDSRCHWVCDFGYDIKLSSRRACALRALGLLLADGTPTVGGGKTFWAVSQIFLRKQL